MTTRRHVLTCIVAILLLSLLFPGGAWSQDGAGVEIPAEWTLLDEVEFDLYLEAGRYLGVHYDQATQTLTAIAPVSAYALTDAARAALDKAPQWLRHELNWIFSQLPSDDGCQERWADAINDANDPYIDEIAFAIAHSSPEYLTSGYGSPELFVRNAELIYENDAALDYVEVVDFGTSDSNDNYYSTTRYVQSIAAVTRTGKPVITTVDAPNDVYYWYVVHPKVSSEIPAFIDPNLAESNRSHNENIADPPAGYFWRDYLFNEADPGYPVLRERLTQCAITGDGTALRSGQAIGVINGWINASMSFTSEGERPHQPIRIYDKHIGRCGEYADFTSAACRAALIPCTSACSSSTDHIWNEFWHERWIHWEPVNNDIDNPMSYESGWGKVFGTVYETRSDGRIRSVTDRYSQGTATIDLTISDAVGIPVDGAQVNLYMRNADAWWHLWDSYALTDNEGRCSFLVGEGLDYYTRIVSDVGNAPEGHSDAIELVSGSEVDGYYSQAIAVAGRMPTLDCNEIDPPVAEESPYRLVVSFAVPEQLLMGDVASDDVASYTRHLEKAEDGQVDFFVTATSGFRPFVAGLPFEVFYAGRDVNDIETVVSLPADDDCYCLFSNAEHLNNLQHLVGSIRLYRR